MPVTTWLRRPSAITAAAVPLVLGLVMNLATNTVQVRGVWTWVVWIAVVVLAGVTVRAQLAPVTTTGKAEPFETQDEQPSRRPGPISARGLHNPLVAALVGAGTTLAVVMFFLISSLPGSNAAPGPNAAPVANGATSISCEVDEGPLTLAISGRQGSPGFSMSPTVTHIVRAAIVGRDQVGSVSLVNVDGQPSVVGQTGVAQLPKNTEAAEMQSQRVVDAVAEEGAKIRAQVPEVDVLGALDTAAIANEPQLPGTIIVFDSGLSTAGGVSFDGTTAIDVAADDMVHYLESSGYMPDLSGKTVFFVGLGATSAPQPSLRPAQRHHLATLWKKIAQASGATCVDTIDEVGHPQPPTNVPAVRPVFVPPPPVQQPDTDTSVVLSAGSELQFHDDTAEFEDEDAAKQSLGPVLRLIAANPNRHVHITGTTSNFGTREDQVRLSEARARAVAELLNELGVPESRITVNGVGSDFPEYIPDTGPDGRVLPGPAQQNRCIRIDLL